MGKILFVDDEENILRSLKRTFFDVSGHDVYFTDSPEDALEIVRESGIHVVVSDIKMPRMSGVELLHRVKQIHEDIVCIALSGHAEFADIKEAINSGDIWRYIDKPWDNDKLVITLNNAIEFYEKTKENRELVYQLEAKKTELERMNRNLEELVQMRTKMLEERTRIMNMIINDKSLDEVFTAVAENIIFFGKAGAVQIESAFLDRNFVFPEKYLGQYDLNPRDFHDSFIVKSDTYVACELKKHDTHLGYMVMRDVSQDYLTELYSVVETFSNLVVIYLYQKKTIQELPQMLAQIESIIGEM
ncbi:MAG: response regulator [Fibrobacterota bacterium]